MWACFRLRCLCCVKTDVLYGCNGFADPLYRVYAKLVSLLRKICPEMAATRFLPPDRASRNDLREGYKISRRCAQVSSRNCFEFLKRSPLIPDDIEIRGFVYDVETRGVREA